MRQNQIALRRVAADNTLSAEKRKNASSLFGECFRADLRSVSRFEARADETAAGDAAAVVGAVAMQNPER
jgi:hypothetical protein